MKILRQIKKCSQSFFLAWNKKKLKKIFHKKYLEREELLLLQRELKAWILLQQLMSLLSNKYLKKNTQNQTSTHKEKIGSPSLFPNSDRLTVKMEKKKNLDKKSYMAVN